MLKRILIFAICILFLSSIASAAFPTGWGRKCALVIQQGKVSATLSNFPVLLTENTLPAEMFAVAGDYEALEGGGDIRFSSDSAGSSRLACEIVKFSLDDADDEAEIWVNVPSVAHDGDTTFYVWYNKSGESQPAEGAAFGQHATWDSNFLTVHHLQDLTTSTTEDSTSNGLDGTKEDTNQPYEDPGQIYEGQNFEADDLAHISLGNSAILEPAGDITLSCWLYMETDGIWQRLIAKNYDTTPAVHYSLNYEIADRFNVIRDNGSTEVKRYENVGSRAAAQWYHVAAYVNAACDAYAIYVNGSPIATGAATGSPAGGHDNFYIGCKAAGNSNFDGIIDEVRVSDKDRGADWVSTEYNNQDDPNSFVVEGTPESPPEEEENAVFIGVNFGRKQ